MKRVVDTSAWIEWIIGKLPRLKDEMPPMQNCIVPTIVQLELTKWAAREGGDDAVDNILGLMTECTIIQLDTRIAVNAADLGRKHRLPTADAIIYATAVGQDADLLTCDAHFENLPHVLYLPKESG